MTSSGQRDAGTVTRSPRGTRQLPAGQRSASLTGVNTALQESAAPAETPDQAHARGFAEGEARALARIKQQAEANEASARRDAATLAAREKSLVTAIKALDAAAKNHADATEETLVRLTLLACAQVLHSLATEHTLVTRVVRAVMAEHGNETHVELLLNRSDHAALPADVLAGMTLPVLPADSIAPGEFRVRTPHRQLDIAIARQYRTLCAALRGDSRHAH